jgi:hypothetical protein
MKKFINKSSFWGIIIILLTTTFYIQGITDTQVKSETINPTPTLKISTPVPTQAKTFQTQEVYRQPTSTPVPTVIPTSPPQQQTQQQKYITPATFQFDTDSGSIYTDDFYEKEACKDGAYKKYRNCEWRCTNNASTYQACVNECSNQYEVAKQNC